MDLHTKQMAEFLQLGEQIQLPSAGIMELLKLGKASRVFLNPTEPPGKSSPIPEGRELLSTLFPTAPLDPVGFTGPVQCQIASQIPTSPQFSCFHSGTGCFHSLKWGIVPLQSPALTEKKKSWEFLFLMDIFPALFFNSKPLFSPFKGSDPAKQKWKCPRSKILLKARDEQSCPDSN